MSTHQDPNSYYYSTYHLARDFIGTAAPFTLFVALATLLLTPVQQSVAKLVDITLRAQSWVIGLFFVGIYVLVAYMAGALSQRFALLFRVAWSSLRKKNIEYAALYDRNAEEIEDIYKRHIRVPEQLLVRLEDKRVDLIDRLCTYFRLYNPQGYNHLYREYTLASMYRQAAAYSLILGVACFLGSRPWAGATFVLSAFTLGFAIRQTVREVTRMEYEFILATAAWIEQSSLTQLDLKTQKQRRAPNLRSVMQASPNPTPAADGKAAAEG